MSTTFYVFPAGSTVPTFGELTDLANRLLGQALDQHGVPAIAHIDVRLNKESRRWFNFRRGHKRVLISMDDPARWSDEEYAWFTVRGVIGGTDAYFCEIDDTKRAELKEQLQSDSAWAARHDLVAPRIVGSHYWYFRRSAGQPGIINLAYGILAAAMALLTDGFIDTEDGAWEQKRFPATAEEFLSWFLVPEAAADPEFREWAERCLRAIPNELESASD